MYADIWAPPAMLERCLVPLWRSMRRVPGRFSHALRAGSFDGWDVLSEPVEPGAQRTDRFAKLLPQLRLQRASELLRGVLFGEALGSLEEFLHSGRSCGVEM